MPDVIALTCRACGGKLRIPKDVEQLACAYCGTEFMVRHEGGTISLAPVIAGLRSIETATNRIATELAIQRLKSEIAALEATIAERIDWFSKRYDYPPRAQHISYQGIIATMEQELAYHTRGINALLHKAEAAKLREFVANFKGLVETLHEKTAELRKCEHMLREE